MTAALISLSETARRANLPRRTLQYWLDHDAIAAGEIEIVRMLRPFARMGSPIGVIKVLAIAFRDFLLNGDDDHPITNARKGEDAYLVVSIFQKSGGYVESDEDARNLTEFGRFVPELYATCDKKLLADVILGRLQFASACPIVVVNLTDALSVGS